MPMRDRAGSQRYRRPRLRKTSDAWRTLRIN
jgi:hypothetical protein